MSIDDYKEQLWDRKDHCGMPVIIQASTGDWYCQNPDCFEYIGHQLKFERGFIFWYKRRNNKAYTI